MKDNIITLHPRCSFCGKLQDDVKWLIYAPVNIFICEVCVHECCEILTEKEPDAFWWVRRIGPEPSKPNDQ